MFARLHTQGNTILLITHEADVAANAARIISIRDGKVGSDVQTRQGQETGVGRQEPQEARPAAKEQKTGGLRYI